MAVQSESSLHGAVPASAVAAQPTSEGEQRASRQDELWRLVTLPGTLSFEVPATSAARERLVREVRGLPPGTDLVLTRARFGSRGHCRRFAREAGIEILREYVAIPSAEPPTCYVEDSRSALRYFFTQLLTLPRGGAAMSAALAAAKGTARFLFPAGLLGPIAPGRIALGRTPAGPARDQSGPGPKAAATLLDMPGMETLLVALSKDPNAKVTVLLIPRGRLRPSLAIKLPTTALAEASIAAERAVLSELHSRLPASILTSIPRLRVIRGVEGRPSLATTALPGSPMTTRYHAWRHLASRAAVQADFLAVETWLAGFQRASATLRAPVDMDGGVTAIMRGRFAGEPSLNEVLGRLAAVHARLRASSTPRTAVHGDFWFGNLLFLDGQVSGVIDWEAGAISGEPVRDLVRFALSYALYLDRHTKAGHRIAGHRGLRAGEWGCGITWAVDGEGWFPELVRDFVRGGLRRLGADQGCWREAMLAGLAEVAATADHLDFARRHWELFAHLSESSASASPESA